MPAPALARGEAFFQERRGQLGLSCADCHERYKGKLCLRGDRVSEGMINGFPIYRLTWQTLGSRHRMFQWCNEAVRATPYPFGAEPYLSSSFSFAIAARASLWKPQRCAAKHRPFPGSGAQ